MIQLRAGSYHLAETVVLGAADSGLTITAYQNEAVEISGGINLTGLAWAPSAANRKVWVTKVPRESLGPAGIPALQVEGTRATLARFPNANPELDLFPTGYVTDKTGWMTPEHDGIACNSSRKECGKSVDVHLPAPRDEWHGM